MKLTHAKRRVSPNNPCPFLRSLVSEGMLANNVATIGDATETIEKVAASGDGSPTLPSLAIRLVALLANGLGPATLLQTGLHGMKLSALRGGPLDKKGVGSRILDSKARVDQNELERLNSFASMKVPSTDAKELGLDADDLTRMMDANFERAGSRRRLIDRALMDAEWPVLLEVMGKEGKDGRYLSVKELRTLFIERELPDRMLKRLSSA